MTEIDPREVLRQARQLFESEQYPAALEKYVWFHDHALDADRSLAGVRLSYAISEWIDLGEVYAPARRALESVRDAKAESLLRGAHDASLFHDVASINRELGQIERTSDLFKIIAGVNRGIAQECFQIALESLVHAQEFGLARSFIPDPRIEIDKSVIPLNFARQDTGSNSQEMLQEALVGIYVKRVSLIFGVLVGAGEEGISDHLRHYAVERVQDALLREKVMERLNFSRRSTQLQ